MLCKTSLRTRLNYVNTVCAKYYKKECWDKSSFIFDILKDAHLNLVSAAASGSRGTWNLNSISVSVSSLLLKGQVSLYSSVTHLQPSLSAPRAPLMDSEHWWTPSSSSRKMD